MGTLREKGPKGSGHWEMRVDAGNDPVTGKRRQMSRSFRGGRREADRALRRFAQEVDDGNHASTEGTLGQLLDAWVANEGPLWSPTHAARVESLIRLHIRPALGALPLSQLRASDLDGFYRYLERSLKPATVRKAHGVLRRALGQAVRWGWIPNNPAVGTSPPAAPRSDVNPPAPEAAMEVVRHLRGREHRDRDHDEEAATFFYLALDTGIRRGEMCGLRRSDFNPEERTLLIRRAVVQVGRELTVKSTKQKRHRRIALDDECTRLVAEQLAYRAELARKGGAMMAPDPYLFPSPRDLSGGDPSNPSAWTRRYRRRADRVGLKGVRLHDSRHMHATQLLGAGADVRTVSGRLGHARASTTLDIYGHFLPALDRKAADLMGAILAEPEHTDGAPL